MIKQEDLKAICRDIVKTNMVKYSITMDNTPRSIHHTVENELVLDTECLMRLYTALGAKDCLNRYKRLLMDKRKAIQKQCYVGASIFTNQEDLDKRNNRLFYHICWLEYYKVVLEDAGL